MIIGYNELLASLKPTNETAKLDKFTITIPDCWMQGRTTYGGLSAALCSQAIQLSYPDLPPLRSSLINFIGPCGGDVTICTRLLRQGKSVISIEASIVDETGIATLGVFSFGSERESKLDGDFITAPKCADIGDSRDFYLKESGPKFLQHFECRLAKGAMPLSNSALHEHCVWLRFREQVEVDTTSLLAIGDMPPPGVFPMLTQFAPISSMNWSVNFLNTNPTTEDGWWLMKTTAENARSGYSSQDMIVWNSDRELVMSSRQNVSIFY